MNDDPEKIKKIIGNNTPFYRRAQIQPEPAGGSLLINNSGFPVVNKQKQPVSNSEDKSLRRRIEPVKVQGGNVPTPQHMKPLIKRGLNHIHTAEELDNKKLNYNQIPYFSDLPVHVGSHNEHGWHDENVTGLSDKYIDNQEYINVEALQGAQRLPHSQEELNELNKQQSDSAWSDDNPPRPVITDIIDSLDSLEMCVFISSEPMYTSSSIDDIIKYVEMALLEYQIPISNIKVIKRLELDFGLIIK